MHHGRQCSVSSRSTPAPLACRLQGYVDAARVFERESGTAPGVELDQITDRMDIRKAVQRGDVEQARGCLAALASCCPACLLACNRGQAG
jgi:hypothetical protein